jgi:hypothetical protein
MYTLDSDSYYSYTYVPRSIGKIFQYSGTIIDVLRYVLNSFEIYTIH